MSDQTEIARLLAGMETSADAYEKAIKRHMHIVGGLREHPPATRFRGELAHETNRRHYWQKKLGKRWTPWDFICAYPLIAKNVDACFVSRQAVIKEYFSAGAKVRQKSDRKKYHSRGAPGTIYLSVAKMVRVNVMLDPYRDRSGFVTALHPTKGYRVTIWPDERWKAKVRRWCMASELETIGDARLPPLPPA